MPGPALAVWERLEQSRVDHRPRRPVEGADEVLALREVDRRLAADRGVDLPDERRRDRGPGDAAEVGRRGEARRRRSCSRRRARRRRRRGRAGAPARGARRRPWSSPPRRAGPCASMPAVRRARAARPRRRSRPRARPRRAPPGRRRAAARRGARASRRGRGRRRLRARRRPRSERPRRRPPRRRAAARRRDDGTTSSSCASGRSPPRARSQAEPTSTRDENRRRALAEQASASSSDPSAPPPSATTFGSRADRASTAASSSISRKADSPQERKTSAIESPARASISRSRSTNGCGRCAPPPSSPSVDLPAPMKPISATCLSSGEASRSARGTPVSRDEVADRVAAELLARGAGELERDRCLGDDRERLDGRRVRALDERLRRLAGGEVDRLQRPHQRRQRLHRRADDDLLAVRDAGLDPARAVRLPVKARDDLVVRLRAAERREREAVADLDALHRLDAHQRSREPRVEPVVLASRTSRALAGRRARAPRRRRRPCHGRFAPRRRGCSTPRARRPSPSNTYAEPRSGKQRHVLL